MKLHKKKQAAWRFGQEPCEVKAKKTSCAAGVLEVVPLGRENNFSRLRDRAGVARQPHKLEVGGSNPPPASKRNWLTVYYKICYNI